MLAVALIGDLYLPALILVLGVLFSWAFRRSGAGGRWNMLARLVLALIGATTPLAALLVYKHNWLSITLAASLSPQGAQALATALLIWTSALGGVLVAIIAAFH